MEFRKFIELIRGAPESPGQVAHMDIYGLTTHDQNEDEERAGGGGWNCSWVVAGNKGTVIKQYPYQGFPDNFTKGVSTLPKTNWDELPDVPSTWDTPGTVLIFRANHIHAGASGERIIGFACQETAEDVEDSVITHKEVFENNKLGLPKNAPQNVRQAVAEANKLHEQRRATRV